MTRKAVLVGINYLNTKHELKGCINDVNKMKSMLIDNFDFEPQHISLITNEMATTANIKFHLQKLVNTSEPGDLLLFHFSGHGTQMYSVNKDDEPDGLDECICPVDVDWKTNIIRDNDLKQIFDQVPQDVQFVAIMDCCNSGDGLDQQNHYKQHEVKPRGFETPVDVTQYASRFITPPDGIVYEKVAHNVTSIRTMATNDRGILISGCKSDQTSADAYINGGYVGACTYHLIDILNEHNFDICYNQLITQLSQRLSDNGFTQQPQLNGPQHLFEKTFINHQPCKKLVTKQNFFAIILKWFSKLFKTGTQ